MFYSEQSQLISEDSLKQSIDLDTGEIGTLDFAPT